MGQPRERLSFGDHSAGLVRGADLADLTTFDRSAESTPAAADLEVPERQPTSEPGRSSVVVAHRAAVRERAGVQVPVANRQRRHQMRLAAKRIEHEFDESVFLAGGPVCSGHDVLRGERAQESVVQVGGDLVVRRVAAARGASHLSCGDLAAVDAGEGPMGENAASGDSG